MDEQLAGRYWVHSDVHARVEVIGPLDMEGYAESVYSVSFYAHGTFDGKAKHQYMTAEQVRERVGREWKPLTPR